MYPARIPLPPPLCFISFFPPFFSWSLPFCRSLQLGHHTYRWAVFPTLACAVNDLSKFLCLMLKNVAKKWLLLLSTASSLLCPIFLLIATFFCLSFKWTFPHSVQVNGCSRLHGFCCRSYDLTASVSLIIKCIGQTQRSVEILNTSPSRFAALKGAELLSW